MTRWRVTGCALVLTTLLFGAPPPALGHEVRPGYLEMTEVAPGRYDVVFKTPSSGGLRLKMHAVLPESCPATTLVSGHMTGRALLEQWTVQCEASLVGETITIDGLDALLTDVLVRIQPLDRSPMTVRLRPASSSFVVPAEPSTWDVAVTYLVLGVEHILGGVDHLLFVLALLLIVSGRWLLLKTITAFTVAHSLTLAAASLGFVDVPSAPVEAMIALSIMFLASELAQDRMGRPGLTSRYPWIVAFTFGLLHGLGFAGALSEVGLPERQIPLALLQFNVGVELGQLLFIGAALAVMASARSMRVSQPVWAWRVPTYSIGAVAAFWTVERVAAFW